MFEQGRKVWWPLKWREYDENGNEVERGMTVLFAIYTNAERAAAKDSALSTMLVDANRRLGEISKQLQAGVEVQPVEGKTVQQQLDEQLALLAQLNAKQLAEVVERVRDWRWTIDDAQVPFSREQLDELVAYPDFAGLFSRGLDEASRGALAKN
ncbi:MAG: hypothetical protein KDI48_06990 [Xanthomonadales bacterium]|nr:hypothetical protein [Xanthomonadales bacterium]